MSSLTTTPDEIAQSAAPTTRPADGTGSLRLTFGRVIHSEWIKLRTRRSTFYTLAGLLVTLVGFGLIAAATATGQVEADLGGPNSGASDPVSTVLTGADLAVLVSAVFGVLVGAWEYSSGLIRTTLAAVPKRLPVLWAKSLTFAATVFPVVLVGALTVFFAGTSLLSGAGVESASWSDPGVARAVVGTAFYLVGIGLIGLALGVIFRSIAGAIGTLVGGLLFLPTLASVLLPESWDSVLKYLPSNAGLAIRSVTEDPSLLSPTVGTAVFVGWVVLALVGAAVLLKRRDA